jgi:hypothetical protein
MQKKFNNSLSKLYNWLDTRVEDGGYNGFVLHRYDSRRVLLNNPTCWAQGPIICGLVNLSTQDKIYEDKLRVATEYQLGLLENESGKYKFCGHEDDRFSSLIQCALANEGLLEAYSYFKSIDNTFSEKILKVLEVNIDKYLMSLWNEEYGVFKFNEIDFYSKDGDRFVANMNVMFIYTLILYSKLISSEKYEKYIDRVLTWLLTQQISSENPLLDGGFTYQQKIGVEPKMQNPVVIYNGIIAEYLSKIYHHRPNKEYRESLIKLKKYLLNNYNKEVGAFYHDYKEDIFLENPYFIAGASFALKGLYELNIAINEDNSEVLTMTELIIDRYQYKNGGFRGFVGYGSKENRKGCCSSLEIWEDVVPTVNWNSKMFEFLSTISSIEKKSNYNSNLSILSWNFIYIERKKKVFILGLFPIKSLALLVYNKKKINPIFAFSLLDIYKKMKGKV